MQGTAEKIAPLTGLRFLAALAIFASHGTGYFYPKQVFGTFNLGGAVPFFFVLSGFILTVRGMGSRTWGDFMASRFARVWPAHVAAIVLLFVVFWPWSTVYFDTALSIVSLCLNVALLHDLFPVPEIYAGYNGVSWSLSAEMVYYAAFPLLLASVSRRPILTSAAVLIGVLATMTALPIAFPSIDRGWLNSLNFISGCWSFTVGVVAGTLYLKWHNHNAVTGRLHWTLIEVCAITMVIAANGWLGAQHLPSYPGLSGFVVFHAAAPVYALLILVFAVSQGAAARGMSTRVMVYLGEISFSLYLVHQIVLRWYDGQAQALAEWSNVSRLMLVLAISLALAAAFYHLIEVPSRRTIVKAWNQRTRKRTPDVSSRSHDGATNVSPS